MSPFCVFPLLLSPPLFSFSSPLFFPSPLLDSPLSPFCVFFGFFVCVFGGGGCGVVCCVGVVWFGLGVMVSDVGVVWMGGSVLGPVWVGGCLAVCAFVRFPCVFWWGVLRVIDKIKKTRATTHTRRERCEHRARGSCFMQPGRACARCTPIYSRRRTTNAHSAFRIRSSSSSVAAPTQPLGSPGSPPHRDLG